MNPTTTGHADDFRLNDEILKDSSTKAVKERFAGVVWPVYEDYEISYEGGEAFVAALAAPVSLEAKTKAERHRIQEDEMSHPWRRSKDRLPIEDAKFFYAPLKGPELILELRDLADGEITPEVVRDWSRMYGVLGFSDEDHIKAGIKGKASYEINIRGMGRRGSVRRFAETAHEIKACVRMYEAVTTDEDVDLEGLSTRGVPLEILAKINSLERHPQTPRSWFFRILGMWVQMRLKEHCFPRFDAHTYRGLANGEFSLTWGFKGLIGAVWLHMAWLLESDQQRVIRCKLPDCRSVIHFEPGKSADELGKIKDEHGNFKRNVKGIYKDRKDRIFCKPRPGRACKQKYSYRKKAGWANHP